MKIEIGGARSNIGECDVVGGPPSLPVVEDLLALLMCYKNGTRVGWVAYLDVCAGELSSEVSASVARVHTHMHLGAQIDVRGEGHQKNFVKLFNALVLIWAAMIPSACAIAPRKDNPGPLIIQEQGSFAVGGTVITHPGTYDPMKQQAPDGQTFHGDHAYVFYQIPEHASKFPLVLWHGFGQFSKTWETTPDGREGFQNLFLRRGFGVYVIDQPRRGNAGRSTLPMTITPVPDEQTWFNIFRVGIWPNYFPGAQFSRDPEALNQYFRQMTPNTGPFDVEVISDAVSALFNKIGPGILVTHSQGGGPGWVTAIKNRNVRAVVSYEPGSGFGLSERGGTTSDAKLRRHPGGGWGASVGFHAAHENPDHHLLRRQHSRAADGGSEPGPVACAPGNGQAMGGRREPPRG